MIHSWNIQFSESWDTQLDQLNIKQEIKKWRNVVGSRGRASHL